MKPATRWLCWALVLLALVAITDVVAMAIGVNLANLRPVRQAGTVVMLLMGGYLLLGLAATALFWWRGTGLGQGHRTVGTIAFLIAQGLVFAFMGLATMLGSNR